MLDRLKDFKKDCESFVGKEATDVPIGAEVADWLTIRRFCAGIGDDNPLYKDPSSGVATKYNSMIAPPTFVAAIRTPTSAGAYSRKDYGVAKFLSHSTMEWVDIIRVGDRLNSRLLLTDLEEGSSYLGHPCVNVTSEATYHNSYGGRIATAIGKSSIIPFDRGHQMLMSRGIYEYSDHEINGIVTDLDNELPPHGKMLRYFEDVKVGDKLPHLVKGPLNLSDLMAWVVAEQKPIGLGSQAFRSVKTTPGLITTNPTTNWPWWDFEQCAEDILSCENAGFMAPFGRGMQRICLAGQILTDWMGDDGFLRYLSIDILGHYIYGDTMWLFGEVLDTYKKDINGQSYGAVDVGVKGVNQLGEDILSGKAVVYLPSPGHPVSLPIPH